MGGRVKEPFYIVGGNINYATAMEISMGFLEKPKTEIPFDPVKPFLDMFLKELKT